LISTEIGKTVREQFGRITSSAEVHILIGYFCVNVEATVEHMYLEFKENNVFRYEEKDLGIFSV
jgi:hypothetical protein